MVKQLKLINDFYYRRPGKRALSSNTCYVYESCLILIFGIDVSPHRLPAIGLLWPMTKACAFHNNEIS